MGLIIYFAFDNFLHFIHARAHVHALMTRKSCAVEMCNTIRRNYLKVIPQYCIAHPYCARYLRHLRAQ